MVAAAFARLKRGGDQSANLRNGLTAAALSKMFNVSTRSIETARVVRAKGAPELVEAVQSGAMKVSTAADLVDFTKDRQRELAAAGKHEVAKAVPPQAEERGSSSRARENLANACQRYSQVAAGRDQPHR
jgi:hypothetical protein